jgi:predicted DNA-binding transcriptional regulator YafY
MTKSERLLHLLQIMRAMHPPIRAADLAVEMGVSERSIYRDIDALRSMGAVIDGAAGFGYTLIEHPSLPPMMFDRTEVEALVLGLREVIAIGDPDLAKAAEHAQAKLRGAIPERYQSVLDHSVLNVRLFRDRDEILIDVAVLRQAAWDEVAVNLNYSDQSGVITERAVYPLSLVYMDYASVLIGWCLLRDDYRAFRLDRMLNLEVLKQSFRPNRARLLREFKEKMDQQSAGLDEPSN